MVRYGMVEDAFHLRALGVSREARAARACEDSHCGCRIPWGHSTADLESLCLGLGSDA